MTRDEELELAPFIDAFAELLLAEERRRAADQKTEHQEKSPVGAPGVEGDMK